MRTITGKSQNTINLQAYEPTMLVFELSRNLEILNLSGATVWVKWTEDSIPQIDGATSSPIPVGMSYYRNNFPKEIGFIASDTTQIIVNVM